MVLHLQALLLLYLVFHVKCQVFYSFQALWRCHRVSDLTGYGCPLGLDVLLPYCLELILGRAQPSATIPSLCSYSFIHFQVSK